MIETNVLLFDSVASVTSGAVASLTNNVALAGRTRLPKSSVNESASKDSHIKYK